MQQTHSAEKLACLPAIDLMKPRFLCVCSVAGGGRGNWVEKLAAPHVIGQLRQGVRLLTPEPSIVSDASGWRFGERTLHRLNARTSESSGDNLVL